MHNKKDVYIQNKENKKIKRSYNPWDKSLCKDHVFSIKQITIVPYVDKYNPIFIFKR